ncbi:MAG: hypothetical protein QM765_38925 [Myxococcales bacterium]
MTVARRQRRDGDGRLGGERRKLFPQRLIPGAEPQWSKVLRQELELARLPLGGLLLLLQQAPAGGKRLARRRRLAATGLRRLREVLGAHQVEQRLDFFQADEPVERVVALLGVVEEQASHTALLQ